MLQAFIIFFLLMVGHAFGDYAFQTEWIANNKNRNNFPKGYDPALHGERETIWPYVLSAHALIHAGLVIVILGNFFYAAAEFVLHWIIDFLKCDKRFGIRVDQWLHIICKLLYVIIIFHAAIFK